MFKRVISILLALVLTVGLVPALGTQASAEGFTASDAAVDLLKKMEGFSKYPYYDYSQFSVGYGTRCPDEDYARYAKEGITEEEAEKLLRTYLEKEEEVLNRFISNKGLSLNQNQYDALVLFSYNCGTSWLYQPGDFHNAVVSGAKGEDLIYAIALWCNAGGSILDSLVRRRLCEANIYLNGEYSITPPANYCYVQYNAQGGTVSSRIEAYDSDVGHGPSVYATYSGFTFEGWYTAKTGGSKVTVLDKSVSGKTLYARWSDGTVQPDPTDPSTDPSTEPTTGPATEPEMKPVTVTVLDSLNVRSGAGTGYSIIGSLDYGTKVEITEVKTAGGYTWGKCSQGWICLYYTNYDSVLDGSWEETKTDPIKGYVVDTNNLRVRSGPGLGYSILGYLTLNTEVEITEQRSGSGLTWGKINQGWICMDYVSLTPAETPAEEESGTYGTVVNSSYLRIRSGAGFSYGVVGTLDGGDRVLITEQKYADGMYWGRIDRGWVSMDYIALDSDTAPTEPEPTEPPAPTDPTESVWGTVINSSYLRIRTGPGLQHDVAGYLYSGNRVQITEQKNADGMTWGKISQGWVSMDYIALDSGEGGSSGGETVTGVVVNCEQLRVRSGAGTDYSIVGYLKQGETVSIGNTTMVGSTKWGSIGWGWISMDYIRVDGESGGDSSQDPPEETTPEENPGSGSDVPADGSTMIGTVVNTGELRVRSGAGLSYSVVGYLAGGTTVEITECKNGDGMIWGRISQGWISLDYVELSENITANGTRICVVDTDYLNVRSDAGTQNPAVSYYTRGDRVEILEEKSVDSVMWGRTSKGWICMDYVK